MYHFIPEITSDHMGPYAALDNFKQVLPKNVSLTCDSWYGMKSWMEFNKHMPLTFALPDTQGNGLWKLFAHDLQKNQFRTFFNGKLMVTVFMGEGLMVTGSTMYQLDKKDPSFLTPNQARTTNVLPSTLQLSNDAIQQLYQFPKEDLIKLASVLGKSTSICYSFKI